MWVILLANFNPSIVTCIFVSGGLSDHAVNRRDTLTESGSTNGTPKVGGCFYRKEYAGQDGRRKKKVVGKP